MERDELELEAEDELGFGSVGDITSRETSVKLLMYL